ncbi:hypothetical protein SAMN05880590_107291 [Rhizobium sp. RU35A]|nr:hypothetical protein SAMN05880590_107291 [Rhizobium sp. RU35A]
MDYIHSLMCLTGGYMMTRAQALSGTFGGHRTQAHFA